MSPYALSEFESYIENPGNYTHSIKDFTLYTTALDTSTLRNIMTTVFVVLNFSIVVVGGCFLRERNLLRLKVGYRKVAINHLTSWITLKGALMYVWHTSRLPGGSAGFSLMMLTGAFGLAQQYFVNSILPVSMQARCDFNSGIVTRANQGGRVAVPVSTFSVATSALNAQVQVFWNGGQLGIYETVNNNYANLSPAEEDILGYWNCSTQQNTIIKKTDWQSDNSIESFLQRQGFLFPNVSSFQAWYFTEDYSVDSFLKWSADQPGDSGEQWKVRASVATHLQGSGAPDGWTANMTNLDCQLVRNVGSDYWIPPVMPSKSTLDEWAPITFGHLMNFPSNSSGVYIEWMLNAMVMVGGSGNNDQRTQMDLPVGASGTYGCSVRGTQIGPEIWAVLIAMFLLFALLVLAVVMLHLYQRLQCEDVAGGDLAKETPSGVEHWQLQLLQAMMSDKTIKLADLGDYEYKWDKDHEYEIRKRNSPARATPSIDPAPATYRSYSKRSYSKKISL